MALNFPNNPTNGQQFTVAGVTWIWDGAKWEANSTAGAYQGPPGPPGPAGPTGPQGPQGATTYQTGPGLHINTATTPQTIDVVTPYLPLTGGRMSGQIGTSSSTGGVAQPNPTTGLMVYGAGGASDAAYIVLQRPGYFAVAFGLDTDNQLAYGGWSLGSGRRVLWDSNNFNPGSYLPLSGGSVSGSLSTSGILVSNGGQVVIYNSTTIGFHVQNANGDWVRMYDDGQPHIETSGSTLYMNYTSGAQLYTATINCADFWSRGNVNTAGNIGCTGSTLSFGGFRTGLGANNGPIVYGDGNWIVAMPGTGNQGFMVYNSGGASVHQLRANGDAQHNNSIIVNGLQLYNNGGWWWTGSPIHSDSDVQAGGILWCGGCSWRNNGGWMYTPQPLLSNSDVAAQGVLRCGGTGGLYWQSNGGYMYTPSPIHTDNYINIAGLVWQNANGGYMYSSTCLMTGGILPIGNNNVSSGLTGNAWAQCAAYYFNNPSSRSEKDEIVPLSSGALDKMRALQPVTFLWKHGENRKRHTGFIADEVAAVMGTDFGGYEIDEDGREGIAYHELTAVLWKACQEMAERIANLEARLA
jgi:hypothetical protein